MARVRGAAFRSCLTPAILLRRNQIVAARLRAAVSNKRRDGVSLLLTLTVLGGMGLVVNRRAVAEGGVQAVAVGVLEVATECTTQIRIGLERPAMEQFRFERVEEGFHVRVLARTVKRGALLHAEVTQAIAKERSRSTRCRGRCGK